MPNELSFQELPDEIVLQIFLYLNLESLFIMNFVAKREKAVSQNALRDILYLDDAFKYRISQIEQEINLSIEYKIIHPKDKWGRFYEDVRRKKEYCRALDAYIRTSDKQQLTVAYSRLKDISVIKDVSNFKFIDSFIHSKTVDEIFECVVLTTILLLLYFINGRLVTPSLLVITTLLGFAVHSFKNHTIKNKGLIAEKNDIHKSMKTEFLKDENFRHIRKLYLIKNHFWEKYQKIKTHSKNAEKKAAIDVEVINRKFEEIDDDEATIRTETASYRFKEIMDELNGPKRQLQK